MSSFGSLNSALTALRYQQVALDVASNNVANVGTDGYVRRRVVAETIGGSITPALWSRPAPPAGGVQPSGIDRMTDALLDFRVRREHGRQTYLDVKADSLRRIETGLAEPGDSGVAAALADLRKTLADAGNAPGSHAARSQVLTAAETLVDAIRLQAAHLSDEAVDQRSHLDATVTEANAVAAQLAATNRTIATARSGGNDASTLQDERDALALRLAELTGATATIQPDGSMRAVLGDKALVEGARAGELAAAASPVTLTLAPADGSATADIAGDLGGGLGATLELITTVIPRYLADLAGVAMDLADHVNTAHQSGWDATGAQGGELFQYDGTLQPAGILGSLKVAIGDPAELALSLAAPSSPGVGNLDGNNGAALAAAVDVDDDYQRLVNGFGSQVASAQALARNQQALTAQVDSAREQLTGVSLDEETVNMLSAQRAYEAAARVMTTVDSVLDTLINRTGVTR
ncbi:flagellar hook-associated protein FlgK [Nocardioides pyridinolyticus]